jgi:CRISPR-associated protein Cas6
MPIINLHYPVTGSTLPTDHGYALYGALARVVPDLHLKDTQIQIGPIMARYGGQGQLRIEEQGGWLRLRLPAEQIGQVLPLAGKQLELDGQRLRVGVPKVLTLITAPALAAKVVLIKPHVEANAFLDAVRQKLTELGIKGEPAIPLVRIGQHAGKPRRLVVRIHGKRIVGYGLQVTSLTAEESLKLQEIGLGGRRKMGCGFFVPLQGTKQ